jgi:hypothetical protein
MVDGCHTEVADSSAAVLGIYDAIRLAEALPHFSG